MTSWISESPIGRVGAIMRSTYAYSDPGFLLVDEMNRMNPLWFCEYIRASNPCGEQPLPSYGCCDLGPIILTRFVRHPFGFGGVAAFDFDAFTKAVALAKHRPDLPAWLDRCLSRAIAVDRRERFADVIEFGFELEHGSLRAVPQALERPSLYDRNPVRFWQVVSLLLLIALLLALAR